MKSPARTTVTAALPYANGPLHIGHIAGAYLPADIYVRSLRARGKEVLFICGSDEHGAAITLRALKEGTTPQASSTATSWAPARTAEIRMRTVSSANNAAARSASRTSSIRAAR